MPRRVIIEPKPAGADARGRVLGRGRGSGGAYSLRLGAGLDRRRGNVVGEGDIKRQTETVLEHVKTVVEEAGGGMDDMSR